MNERCEEFPSFFPLISIPLQYVFLNGIFGNLIAYFEITEHIDEHKLKNLPPLVLSSSWLHVSTDCGLSCALHIMLRRG